MKNEKINSNESKQTKVGKHTFSTKEIHQQGIFDLKREESLLKGQLLYINNSKN